MAGNGRVDNFKTCLHIRARGLRMLAKFSEFLLNFLKIWLGRPPSIYVHFSDKLHVKKDKLRFIF